VAINYIAKAKETQPRHNPKTWGLQNFRTWFKLTGRGEVNVQTIGEFFEQLRLKPETPVASLGPEAAKEFELILGRPVGEGEPVSQILAEFFAKWGQKLKETPLGKVLLIRSPEASEEEKQTAAKELAKYLRKRYPHLAKIPLEKLEKHLKEVCQGDAIKELRVQEVFAWLATLAPQDEAKEEIRPAEEIKPGLGRGERSPPSRTWLGKHKAQAFWAGAWAYTENAAGDRHGTFILPQSRALCQAFCQAETPQDWAAKVFGYQYGSPVALAALRAIRAILNGKGSADPKERR